MNLMSVGSKGASAEFLLSLRKQGKSLYTAFLESYYEQVVLKRLTTGVNPAPRATPIVVSLTTIPRRLFDKTYLAIATLLNQKFPPDRIVLWISNELKHKPLPSSFDRLVEAGLEIEYCEDIGPHTKLIHALAAHPDSIIVTADDDRLYPSNWLGELYASYQRAPANIHCQRAHLMHMIGQEKLAPYAEWKYLAPGVMGPSKMLFITGTSGVLYPPRSFSDEIFHVEAFRKLCPTNDDIWFTAMALLNGTLCQKVRPKSRQYTMINGSQVETLISTNTDKNDEQIRATFEAYDLYRVLQ
jgi:hypothetical protein